MTSELRLTTTLERRGPAAAIVLTDEQAASLGGGAKAFPVRITIGAATVEARLARMGGENLVGLSKERRAALGVDTGDTVDVVLVHDAAERTVEVPDDLAEALTAAGVRDAFDALAYSHRKEHARSVTEAKKPETRARRVSAVVAALSG
ncbi:YdeI/OmpD-associated family protein [Geodermatophilus sp. FMUSA9-8]|uniref:YdeI/OmpD-associated family protein n=1 Tax=Geodermatophilus sp. FMUSA9-8 TaxID=3120155 RepID=UPI00300946AC